MLRVDHKDLAFPEGDRVSLRGVPFTGQAVTGGRTETSVQTFVEGIERGPEFSWDDAGQLLSLGHARAGGMPVGPLHYWDPQGGLVFEQVNDPFGNQRLVRTWDASGRLVGEERYEAQFGRVSPETAGKGFIPWQTIRLAPGMEGPEYGGFLPAVGIDDLTVADVEGLGRRVLYQDTPFTGEAVTRDPQGSVEMHTFVEGIEDGPTLAWSPSGKLVAQGITQHPHGPVGPWHQWDEQGRLLRETVHDALGNRIIVRELDEAGNIAREERRPPARLVRDPATGEERPAPWL
ncbi:hypothetical protein [Nocardiopsis tropica]|uniref:Uncharacterized protein n=1 Tax=Nocardiopsis tropica TaxID=109330 RepID=A0ABU7KXB0_9ACTN|nr:hypothetical protein [Nocardiopsis umidischolae]MEE2053938.1 hypothetical protein [Nocardiopsis umidischolae]